MQPLNRVLKARVLIGDKLMEEGLSDQQKTLLIGMLTALVWCSTVPADPETTLERMLSGEPLGHGQTAPLPDFTQYRV